MCDTPHILLINPWIHDFAAYDFWARPLGLLTLAAILRHHGCRVNYIDCLDRFHPDSMMPTPRPRNGRGPYLKTQIPKPGGFDDVPRRFSRYGISTDSFIKDLKANPEPDLILVTSIMTYWAPGVRETIEKVKTVYPAIPVVLGGIYATLCREHAKTRSGADRVVTGPAEDGILDLVREMTGYTATPAFDAADLDTYPYPAFDLQHHIPYIPLLTSRGCPFDCPYCASHFLSPEPMHRTPGSVVAEIRHWHEKYNIMDFAFYDDALLVNAETHALPLLEGIVAANFGIRFHTPNALHIREISTEAARLMHQAGFKTLRLGLETADRDHRTTLDRKVTISEFEQTVSRLKRVGFDTGSIGVYLMVGLPGQTAAAIETSIDLVKKCGATPMPTYYTPIPHTALWSEAVAASRYDLNADPVFTNNTVLPCSKKPFSWDVIRRIKNRVTA